MKRMMKSKILATALCATVMAGIYASPVMAEKLYYGTTSKIVSVAPWGSHSKEITNLALDGKLTVGEIEVGKLNGVKLGDLVDMSALEQEKNDRKNADAAIRGEIGQELADRAKADQELADKIGQEEAKRQAEDDSIRGEIGQEAANRANADAKLDQKITDEATTRANEDAKLDKKITDEATTRANEDKRIEAKFDGEVSRLDGRIDKLNDNVQKVGAMAAAIANLHTMGYDPEAPTEIAVGVGQYRDKTGLALGAFHYPNRDFMLSFSVSTAGDEFMGGIGATWKFGRKSPEELRQAEAEKAAKAKLAKAEAAKKAAKDARVAAQQKRHAEMLAARTGK